MKKVIKIKLLLHKMNNLTYLKISPPSESLAENLRAFCSSCFFFLHLKKGCLLDHTFSLFLKGKLDLGACPNVHNGLHL